MADSEETHHGSGTECLLLLCFSGKVRNDSVLLSNFGGPVRFNSNIKTKIIVVRMKTKKKTKTKENNNIPYMPLLEG